MPLSFLSKILCVLIVLLPLADLHPACAATAKSKRSAALQQKKPGIHHKKVVVRHKKAGAGKRQRLAARPKTPPVLSGQAVDSSDTHLEHTEIERNIQTFLNNLREKGQLSRDEISGWMVYDITQERPLVHINGDRPFQAASMIKPFVALAFFHQVEQGKLKYTPESRAKMEAMIQRSNNAAANWCMRKVGGPAKCDAILKTSYGYIFKRTDIKEFIPAGGRTYRNTAPPSDYIRFLLALWKRKLPYDAEMQRLMALPGRDRLHDGTSLPGSTRVYNKTGTTAHLCGDMGILVPTSHSGQPYPYAIVGIIERRSRASDYETWMATRGNIIRHVSSLVYEDLKRQHRL